MKPPPFALEPVDKPAGDNSAVQPPDVDRLIAIWSRVLQTSPVLPETNFFDLGGDSLLAMTLLLEIERETGCKIPFTAIYDAPTVTAMAAFLRQQPPAFSPLVCLKDGDGAPPFFMVHGIGGTVMELARLANLIDYCGPVYGIQARGLDGAEPPLANIKEMAAFYLQAIRQIQPEDPYYLSGYSFGGLVAIEMGRQLMLAGNEVGLLVLVDSYPHPNSWPLRTRLAVRWRRSLHRIGELGSQPFGETLSFMLQKATRLMPRDWRGQQQNADERMFAWLLESKGDLPPALRAVRMAGHSALSSYAPQPYPGDVIFLRAERPDPEFPTAPAPVWRPLVRELAIHTVRGNHFTIVAEHAESIAGRLSQSIAQARMRHVAGCLPRRPETIAKSAMESVPC